MGRSPEAQALKRKGSLEHLHPFEEMQKQAEKEVRKQEKPEKNFLRKIYASDDLALNKKKTMEWYDDLDSFRNVPPETQRYLQEATQSRIKQLEESFVTANKEITEGQAKAKIENDLKPDKDELNKKLLKEVEETRKELKDKLEEEKDLLRRKLQHNSSDTLPWLQHKMAESMATKEKKESMDSALKAYGDVPGKLLEASNVYEKEVEGVKKLAPKVQEIYRNLCNARAAVSGTTHEETTLDHFDKALSEARSNQSVQDIAKKAGETARKSRAVAFPNEAISKAIRSIETANEEERGNLVKKLLDDTVVNDTSHTSFRLTKSDKGDTHLTAGEYKQKRLNEITSQDTVREAIRNIQKIEPGTDANKRESIIRENLEKAYREASLYSLDKNAQESVIHTEATRLFSDRIAASAQTRKDALEAVLASQPKPGRQANIDKIRAANKQVHDALNVIQHFSPEAKAVRTDFRNKYKDDKGADSSSMTREEAIESMNDFKTKDPQALESLAKEIEDHIKVNADTDMSKIHAIAKASIDKLSLLGQREKDDSVDIDASAFDNLRKKINDRYDSQLEKVRIEKEKVHDEAQKKFDAELEQIALFRKNREKFDIQDPRHSEPQLVERKKQALKEYTKSTLETTQKYEKLTAERDAALDEARQLYSKESVSHYIKEIREQAKNLHVQLNKRDQALLKVNDVIQIGYRAEAIKKRYEISQYGEALKLDDDILAKMKEGSKLIADESKAVARVAAEQEKAHDAENEFSLRTEYWELKRQIWTQADKKRLPDSASAQEKKDAQIEKDEALYLMKEAEKERDEARKAKNTARQNVEKAIADRDVITSKKVESEHELHMLQREREVAGKRDDANDAKYFRFLDRIRDDMKATMAFERQRILMRDHYRQQIKAAIVAGISQTVMQTFDHISRSQYNSLNTMLMRN